MAHFASNKMTLLAIQHAMTVTRHTISCPCDILRSHKNKGPNCGNHTMLSPHKIKGPNCGNPTMLSFHNTKEPKSGNPTMLSSLQRTTAGAPTMMYTGTPRN
jgi:ribosomal protein S27AE